MSITNVITKITVDMAGDVKRFAVKAKQYDRATRVIVVSLLWDEVPYVLDSADTVRCNVHKPDGTIAIIEGDNIAVSGNTVTITLPGSALTAAGRAWADIEIETQDESQQVSCQCFEIDIAKSPVDDDSIISTNEFSAMKLATKAANDAAAAATAEIEATAAAGTAASQAAAAAQAATDAANQAAAAATASIQIDPTLTDNSKAAPAGMVGEIKEDLSDIQPKLEAIHDSVEQLPIGLPEAQKALIISIMRNALYSTDISANIDALEDAFFANIPATAVTLNKTSVALEGTESQVALVAIAVPLNTTDVIVWTSSNSTIATVDSNGLVTAVGTGTCIITATAGTVSATCSVTVVMVSIVSIDAAYTQSGTVYTTDSLDSLKDDLVVTAHWSNGTTTTVDNYDYTLSGTLAAGTSTITVTYAGCEDTFTVTVTQKDLDTIAYENKSYRDIFMTGNMLVGTDFENGLPSSWSVNAGSPEITTEDYSSAGHSLKAFGTGSAQYNVVGASALAQFGIIAGKTYYNAFKGKCERYVSGNLGISTTGVNANEYIPITNITNGWMISSKVATAESDKTPVGVFIGSYKSANLDGYIDDIVHINLTDMFATVPSKETIDELYEAYCTLRNGGAS